MSGSGPTGADAHMHQVQARRPHHFNRCPRLLALPDVAPDETDCRQGGNVDSSIAGRTGNTRLTLEQRRVDPRPPPPGILMRATLLPLGGRNAPVGDPSPSPWRSVSVSSPRSNEAFFFDISRWSSGRLTAYIAPPRHARQAMKPTHSSRKTSGMRSPVCRVPAHRAINTVWTTRPSFMLGLRVGLR
jgi:hypothetical protein